MIQTIAEMEELFPDGIPSSVPKCDCNSHKMVLDAMAGWAEAMKLLSEREERIKQLESQVADYEKARR